MEKAKKSEIEGVCRKVQGFDRLEPKALRLDLAECLGGRLVDDRKIGDVCSEGHSAAWYTENDVHGDGDGYGSAFPQQTAWEGFARSLVDLVASDAEEGKAIFNVVMGFAPMGR